MTGTYFKVLLIFDKYAFQDVMLLIFEEHVFQDVFVFQGAVFGLLEGLTQLNCSELTLKKINYRRGYVAINKLK